MAPALTQDSTIELHNGLQMPRLGLGTWRTRDGGQAEQAVHWALETGYRLIDTAHIYGNESSIGKALQSAQEHGLEIFLTTKVWNSDQGYESTLAAFESSARKLQREVLDLYLIHWPVKGLFAETWRALEDLYRAGRVRAIGVSNFLVAHLQELKKTARILPMVNQIEFHPYLQSPQLLALCAQLGIVVEAWAPLMKGAVTGVPELQAISRRCGKTPAQVSLRWLLQKDIVAIPKSTHRQRIVENAALFDFSLSSEEMALLDSLDCGRRYGPDPADFAF